MYRVSYVCATGCTRSHHDGYLYTKIPSSWFVYYPRGYFKVSRNGKRSDATGRDRTRSGALWCVCVCICGNLTHLRDAHCWHICLVEEYSPKMVSVQQELGVHHGLIKYSYLSGNTSACFSSIAPPESTRTSSTTTSKKTLETHTHLIYYLTFVCVSVCQSVCQSVPP